MHGKPLGSLSSPLSHAPQLPGPNPVSLLTLLLASPSSSAITTGVGSTHWITVWGALIHIWRPEVADGCDISCLSVWQKTFSFHTALPNTSKPYPGPTARLVVPRVLQKQIIKNNNKAIKKTNQNASVTTCPTQTLFKCYIFLPLIKLYFTQT